MFLIDDDQSDVGERGDDREPRPDDDVHVARPDPPPLVRPLALAEPRVEQRDPGVEVGAQPIDERQRERDLGDQHERRAAGLERRGDGLDVDGGLAAAGDAVEQERSRRVGRDRGPDPLDRIHLGRQEVAAGRSSAAKPRRPSGQGSARPLADIGCRKTPSDEAGQRGVPVVTRELGRRESIGGSLGKLGERFGLAGAERPARRTAPRRQHRGHLPARIGRLDPAFVARAGAGAEQHPLEADPTLRLQRPQPAEQPGATVGPREIADRARPAFELGEEIGHGGIGRGRTLHRSRAAPRPGRVTPCAGCELRDQLESLEEPRREHRAEDKRGRREVAIRDPASEPQAQRREQRPVGSDTIDDRLGRRRGECSDLGQDDAQRLAPSELDQDGLAELEVVQPVRDEIRVRPVTAGGVDGDLDSSTRSAGGAFVGRRLDPERIGQRQGDRG